MISVIIPTWNGEKTIAACVNSLLSQSFPAKEIIVVNNGSTDKSGEIIQRNFSQVKLISLPVNTGVTGGRNTGILYANHKSNFLFFFDHDMIADPQLLDRLAQTSKKFNADIVTPKIYYKKPKNLIWSAGTGINLWTGQVLFRNGEDNGQYDHEEEVQVAPAAMLVSRKVISTIGGFDEDMFASWEDTDLCFRASRAGFKIYYSPLAIAYHDLSFNSRDEAKRLLTRYPFQIGRNRIIFMKRFGKHWPIFLFFLPGYVMYYGFIALKFQQFKGFEIFLRGTISGLVKSVKIHT